MKRKILPFLLPAILTLLIVISCFSPFSEEMEEASIGLNFPKNSQITGWTGVPKQESAEERRILAEDTEFSKYEFTQEMPISLGEVPPKLTAQASIVLSGHDMNNSIHRPEYCLPAQGHFDMKSSTRTVPIRGFGDIKLTQLDTLQNVTPNDKTPTILNCIHYYVFVGNKQFTNNHIERLLLDIKDRIFFGKIQRWAYFQISTPYGKLIGRTKEEAEKETENLIGQLLYQLIDWESIKGK